MIKEGKKNVFAKIQNEIRSNNIDDMPGLPSFYQDIPFLVHFLPKKSEEEDETDTEDKLDTKPLEQHFIDLISGDPSEIPYFNYHFKIPQGHSIEEFNTPDDLYGLLAQMCFGDSTGELASITTPLISFILKHTIQPSFEVFASPTMVEFYLNSLSFPNPYLQLPIIDILTNLYKPSEPSFNLQEQFSPSNFYPLLVSILNNLIIKSVDEEIYKLDMVGAIGHFLNTILHPLNQHSPEDEALIFEMLFMILQTNCGTGFYFGTGLFLRLIINSFDFSGMSNEQLAIFSNVSTEPICYENLKKIFIKIRENFSEQIQIQFFSTLCKTQNFGLGFHDHLLNNILGIDEGYANLDFLNHAIEILGINQYLPEEKEDSQLFQYLLHLFFTGTFSEKESSLFYFRNVCTFLSPEFIITFFEKGAAPYLFELIGSENRRTIIDALHILYLYCHSCEMKGKNIFDAPGMDNVLDILSGINEDDEECQTLVKELTPKFNDNSS